jgi:hypothetical protein
MMFNFGLRDGLSSSLCEGAFLFGQFYISFSLITYSNTAFILNGFHKFIVYMHIKEPSPWFDSTAITSQPRSSQAALLQELQF